MTIKQCIKNGWKIEKNSGSPYRSMDVNIGFENDGIEDETQFLINSYDVNELTQLYSDFCKENNIPNNTVTYITIVQFYEEKA